MSVRTTASLAAILAIVVAYIFLTTKSVIGYAIRMVIFAELVASARPKVGLIDARELAEELGVARDWVYANAERLGGVRLGNGPRARLRFDVELAQQALTSAKAFGSPYLVEEMARALTRTEAALSGTVSGR